MPARDTDIAERAAVIQMWLGDSGIKLGGAGLLAHYAEVAEIALDSFIAFPLDMDWRLHMDSGRDCWDFEIEAYAREWVEQRYNVIEYWKDQT